MCGGGGRGGTIVANPGRMDNKQTEFALELSGLDSATAYLAQPPFFQFRRGPR